MTTPSERLRQALELADLGFAIQRQNIRRRNPEWCEREVEAAFRRWLHEGPGDAPADWPRRRPAWACADRADG